MLKGLHFCEYDICDTKSIFGLLGGGNKNVLELPKTQFKDKKVADFHMFFAFTY